MTRTKLIWLLAGVCGALLMQAVMAQAAPQMKMVTIGGDDMDGSAMIGELGALIFEKDSTLTVEHVMEANQRPKAYKDVDLKKGDVILMANGKRMHTADDLNAILDSLTTGEDIKLGIRRDKDMQIVSFKKAAPEDLPQIKMVTQSMPGEWKSGGEGGQGGPKTVMHTEGDAGPNGQLAVLGGSGLIFKQDSDAVVVLAIIPDAKDALGGADVQEGDRIIKIQDKDVTDLAMLQKTFDAIETGQKVSIILARDGKELPASFAKSDKQENIMIQKK